MPPLKCSSKCSYECKLVDCYFSFYNIVQLGNIYSYYSDSGIPWWYYNFMIMLIVSLHECGKEFSQVIWNLWIQYEKKHAINRMSIQLWILNNNTMFTQTIQQKKIMKWAATWHKNIPIPCWKYLTYLSYNYVNKQLYIIFSYALKSVVCPV